MQMLVHTDDGKSMHVQVGPAWYLDHHNLDMKENPHVQVTEFGLRSRDSWC